MMLSHDMQHFVNTREKMNTTTNIMERLGEDATNSTSNQPENRFRGRVEGGISSLNNCSAMPLCIALLFLFILIHPHIIYNY